MAAPAESKVAGSPAPSPTTSAIGSRGEPRLSRRIVPLRRERECSTGRTMRPNALPSETLVTPCAESRHSIRENSPHSSRPRLRSLSGKQAVSRQEDVDASSGCAGSSPHLSPQHVLRLLVPALQRGTFAPQQRTKAAPSHNQFVDGSFKKSARDDASTCVMVNAQPR